jgi:WD domain, G-beta repeat
MAMTSKRHAPPAGAGSELVAKKQRLDDRKVTIASQSVKKDAVRLSRCATADHDCTRVCAGQVACNKLNVRGGSCISTCAAQRDAAPLQRSCARNGQRVRALQDIKRTSDLAAPIMQLEGHEGEVFTCKFSPNGDLFASAGHDKAVFLWRPLHPDCDNFAVLRGHKSAILELHWSPDNERIVTASPDKTVRAWDVAYGVQVKKMGEHTDVVNSCHVLRRGAPLVVSGSEDTTIKVRMRLLPDKLATEASAARRCACHVDRRSLLHRCPAWRRLAWLLHRCSSTRAYSASTSIAGVGPAQQAERADVARRVPAAERLLWRCRRHRLLRGHREHRQGAPPLLCCAAASAQPAAASCSCKRKVLGSVQPVSELHCRVRNGLSMIGSKARAGLCRCGICAWNPCD